MASKMNKKELYEAYKKLKAEYMKELVCQGAPTDYQEKLEQLEYTNQILEETISELREQVSDLNECISMMKDEQDENIQLKKENEELKKENQETYEKNMNEYNYIMKNTSYMKYYNNNEENEVKTFKDYIIMLEKENEELHETIKKYQERYGGLIL